MHPTRRPDHPTNPRGKRSLLLCSLLCLIPVAGCILDDGGSGGSGPAAGLMPGDSLQKALDGNAGDSDTVYIPFAARSGKGYRLVTTSDSASKIRLSVTDLDTALQFTSTLSDFSRRSALVDFPCLKSGTYLLRVVGPAGTTFRASVEVSDGLPSSYVAADPFEPDSTLHQAKTISPDGLWNQRTATSGLSADVDWFRVRTVPGHIYGVEFHDSIVLYGTTHTLWRTDSVRVGNPVVGSLEFPSFDTGWFAFRVDGAASGVRYRVRVVDRIGYPSGSVLPDAYEPDDSLRPTVLAADSALVSRNLHGLGSTRDTDWMAIPLDSGRTYRVAVLDSTSILSRDIRGVPGGMAAVWTKGTLSGKGRVDTFTFPAVSKGSARLRIAGSTPGGYAVRAWSGAGLPDSLMPEAGEPDDRFDQAFEVAVDAPATVKRVSGSDSDWVFARNPSGSGAVLRIRNLSDSSILWRPAPNVLARTIRPGATDSVRRLSVAPGRIQVHVWASSGTTRSRYSVEASRIALPADPLEPDDASGSPSRLQPGPEFSRRWVSSDDTDWMAFDVPRGQVARIVTVAPTSASGSLSLTAFDPDMSEDGVSGRRAGDTTTAYIARSGRILLRATTSLAEVLAYQIRVDTLLADSTEPDSTPALAHPIALDGEWKSAILSGGDTDWFSFPVRSGWVYKPQWQTPSDAPRFRVEFEGRSVPLVHFSSDSGFEAPGDGTAFVALTRVGTPDYPLPTTKFKILSCAGDSLSPLSDSAHPLQVAPDGIVRVRHLAPGNDEWMSIPVTAGATYAVEDMDKRMPGPRMSAWFDGGMVAQSQALSAGMGWTATSDGILRLHLQSGSGAWTTTPDSFVFSVREYPPIQGISHDSTKAMELPTDSTFLTVPTVSSASDYYRFRVESGKSYAIWVQTSSDYRVFLPDYRGAGADYTSPQAGVLSSMSAKNADVDGYCRVRVEPTWVHGFAHYRIAISAR